VKLTHSGDMELIFHTACHVVLRFKIPPKASEQWNVPIKQFYSGPSGN